MKYINNSITSSSSDHCNVDEYDGDDDDDEEDDNDDARAREPERGPPLRTRVPAPRGNEMPRSTQKYIGRGLGTSSNTRVDFQVA